MGKRNFGGWKTQAPIDCKPGTSCEELDADAQTCEPPCSPLWDNPYPYVTCDLWYRGKTRTDKDGRYPYFSSIGENVPLFH